jgi:hypothetical protein
MQDGGVTTSAIKLNPDIILTKHANIRKQWTHKK